MDVIPAGSKLIQLYPLKKNEYVLVDAIFADENKDIKFRKVRGGRYVGAEIDGELIYLHHLVIGNPPEGLETDHINQIRDDNRACNLRHVSHLENSRNRPSCKLTIEKVGYINFALMIGIKVSQIAKDFNISKGHVYNIKNGRVWGDV